MSKNWFTSCGFLQSKKLHCLIIKSLTLPDTFLYNNLISHANYGTLEDSVKVYKLMLKCSFVNLSRITFSTMLILAIKQASVTLGMQVHGHIWKFGFVSYVFVGSPLVDFYSKTRRINDAKRVFDELSDRNLVVYNTMISGFFRCGMPEDSKHLFHKMPETDSISWTAMVTGLTENGLGSEAVDIFREMISEGFLIDQFTCGSVLTACGGLLALKQGKQIHAYVIRTEYKDSIFVGSALVDILGYTKDTPVMFWLSLDWLRFPFDITTIAPSISAIYVGFANMLY
ncbi:hypothetical protein MKX01_038224 [Papaver californicum]|nr:hypothetical protein MKX01_038224 [Papaver californicum]